MRYNEPTVISDGEKWLQSGSKTEITKNVKSFADKIGGEGLDGIRKIQEEIKKFPSLDGVNRKKLESLTGGSITDFEFSRTADDILQGRAGRQEIKKWRKNLFKDETGTPYTLGCGDFNTLFIATSRAKGIPIKEVHTLSEPHLRAYLSKKETKKTIYSGHSYALAKVGGKWILLNPVAGTIEIGRIWKPLKSLEKNILNEIPTREICYGELLTEILPGGWTPCRVRAVGLDEWDDAIGIKNHEDFKKRFKEFAEQMRNQPEFMKKT